MIHAHIDTTTAMLNAMIRPCDDADFEANLTTRPTLIGTWAAATWAIGFYEKHGFRLVTPEEKDRLLKRYWSIPERQVETSVVLADERWRFANHSTALRPKSWAGRRPLAAARCTILG